MNRRISFLIPLLLLAACSRAPDGTSSEVGAISLFDPVAANPSLCGSPAIPYPNNALFSGFADPTLNIPNPAGAPFVTAANLTDGFSTSASIFTDVLGELDYATAQDAVVIFETSGAGRFLTYGVDYTLQTSIAMAQVSGTGHSTGTCTGSIPARFQPIAEQRSRILIEPLKPLKASTTYIVAVTKDLKSKTGLPTLPNEFFRAVNTDTKLCRLSGGEAGTEAFCSAAGAGAAAAAATGVTVLALMDATKLGTLETLRRSLIRPTVQLLQSANSGLSDDNLVIAWSFTTQSVDKTLANINTTPFSVPRTLGVGSTTLNTNQANAALNPFANIYAGTVSLPYFLDDTSGSVTAPLSTFWAADPSAPDVGATFLGQVPCGAFATGATVNGIVQGPSVSTTVCYPRPVLKSNKTVPVLVTVPNSTAPGNCGERGTLATGGFTSPTCVAPAGGWPVVVFQHGITRNRSDMLAIAPTLAAAGFVVVAIDMPLHGIMPSGSAGTCGATSTNGFYAGSAERTFNLDLVSNTSGAAGPDEIVDCSGTHFVNLASLITSRDNLRQAESDLIHLVKSVNGISFSGGDDINEAQISFVGQSLGAIVGTTVLGVNTDIGAASLNVPGGGIGKLLDASASFGPRISAGLGALGVFEGTDTYETFVRFAQHLVDPADPINFAVTANANHAIHLTQVIGDAVVPNSAGNTCADPFPTGLVANATTLDPITGTAAASGVAGALMVAACPPLVIPASPPLAAITYQDKTVITGYLSGTDALVRIMGLTNTVTMGSAPFTAQASAGADTVVQFGPTTAEHGTLLTPDSSAVGGADATFAAGTCAMQKQTATFLATGGTVIPVGGTCP